MAVVSVSGARIHYEVRGDGPPVMLVAGTGYSGSTWHPRLCEALAARYRLLTFDHRGTGASAPTDDDYTTRMFGEDAAAVIRAAGVGPVHLIGHSMGGRVAQQVYVSDPSLVRSLTLAASGAGAADPVPFERVGIPIGAVRGMLRAGYERYICDKHRSNFFTAAFADEHPDEVEWLDQAYLDSAPSADDYLKHVRARQAHSTVAVLPSVTVPVLIVVGTADTHNGGTGSHLDSSHQLHNLVPNAQFVLIPGAKHGFMWENVDTSVSLFTSFIDSVDEGKA
jgi:pimeloyl-ACP methyl ester carboxylesterase